MLTIMESRLAFRSPFVERFYFINIGWLFHVWQSFITPSLCKTTLYQLLVLANYSVYDSPLLPHESVYDYPLPIISIG